MNSNITQRPPLPAFTFETATQKVRLAEDSWNSRDPQRAAQRYALDSHWRNRAEFVNGRPEIVAFLARKWAKELDYRLIKVYGVYRPSDGTSERALFVINAEGIIHWSFVSPDGVNPGVEGILSALEGLRTGEEAK